MGNRWAVEKNKEDQSAKHELIGTIRKEWVCSYLDSLETQLDSLVSMVMEVKQDFNFVCSEAIALENKIQKLSEELRTCEYEEIEYRRIDGEE